MALTDNLQFAHFCEETDTIAAPTGAFTPATPSGLSTLAVTGSPPKFAFDGSMARSWTHSTTDGAFAPGTGNFTVAARVTVPTGVTALRPFFDLGAGPARTVGLAVQSTVNRTFKGRDSSDPSSNYILTTNSSWSYDTPCTVVMGRDSTTGFIYVNGADRKSSGTWGRSTDRNYGTSNMVGETVAIGSEADGTNPVAGSLEWVVAWHRDLTVEEITEISSYTRDQLKVALGFSGGGEQAAQYLLFTRRKFFVSRRVIQH